MKAVYEAIKTVAIEFAEWLNKNQWVKKEHTHPNKAGKYWSDKWGEYMTIEELFEMFKNQS